MGRAPCCSKIGLHRGPWTPREDSLLTKYIQAHGEGQWRSLPKRAGLLRCGKSCRLRWMNYLRPDIKRGNITPEEDDLIIRMHSLLGNRWSLIAGRLPGRTDNEIKNYWNTHLSKKLKSQATHHKLLTQVTPGKKNKSKNKNNKQKNNNNNNNKGSEKTLVYLPKPIRVKANLLSSLPRNDSTTFTFDSNNSGSVAASTSQEKLQSPDQANEVNMVNWDEGDINGGIMFFAGEHALINDYVESHPDDVHTDHGTLEKLYEEYLQLLKHEDKQDELDSFAQSLLL